MYQHLGDQLTEDKRVQLGELIDWYEQRVLRRATGNNSLVEHSTELTSDEPTRSKPYPIQYSVIQKMLQTGEIRVEVSACVTGGCRSKERWFE